MAQRDLLMAARRCSKSMSPALPGGEIAEHDMRNCRPLKMPGID